MKPMLMQWRASGSFTRTLRWLLFLFSIGFSIGIDRPSPLLAQSLVTPDPNLAVATPVVDPAGKPPLTSGALAGETRFVSPEIKAGGTLNHTATFLAPQITFWYGEQQSFGQWGNPTPWVNVLGNVTSTVGIATLTYTLNGGASQPLSLGPDTRRLAEPGDFNVELAIADLHAGANAVVVTATDQNNLVSSATMTVNYTVGAVWPLPYTADWGAASTIHAVAPVVDGQWAKRGDTIRPLVFEYDRLIGIGDLSWQSYEVVVPVTIHAIDEEGYDFPSSGPGVGILLRWQGHFQEANEQPRVGWQNLGGLGWFRWGKDGLGNPIANGQLLGYNGVQITTNYQLIPSFELPYLMRMQVETVAAAGDWYRFKVWPAAQAEPTDWQMVGQGFAGEPEHGSFLLVAHEADASFGTVEVCPLQAGGANSFRPTVNLVGEGEVTLTPDRANYRCGEVVTLQATPAPGWRLGSWSGAASGDQNPYPLALRGTEAITATFVQESAPLTYTLLLPIVGNGMVSHTPQQDFYLADTTVTLTATAAAGWQFAGWDLAGNGTLVTTPSTAVAMTSNRVVTATFVPRAYQVALTAVGNGTVNRSLDLPSYDYGTAITLTAQPAVGWRFERWQGDVTGTTNPLPLTVTQSYAIETHFRPIEVSFSLAVEGEGTVETSAPPGLYPYGTTITLTATPTMGYNFLGWAGAVTGNSPTVSLLLDGDKTLTARFAPISHTLTLQRSGEGDIVVEPAGPYLHNQTIELQANPRTGWHFRAWAGALEGEPNPAQLRMDGDKMVTAIFEVDVANNRDYQRYLPFVTR